MFSPLEIEKWTDFDSTGTGTTAICPHCSVDSLLGEKAGFPLTVEFLSEMERFWFNLKNRS
jgi:hypothetical protein